MTKAEFNKFFITALQNLCKITVNYLNFYRMTLPYTKRILLMSIPWFISRHDKRWDKSKN